jgi:hypothetical protein
VIIFPPGALDIHDGKEQGKPIERFKVKLYWKGPYLRNMGIVFGVQGATSSQGKTFGEWISSS